MLLSMLKGAGRGLVITLFLEIVKKLQRHCKGTAKKTAKLSSATLSMFFFVFCFLFCSFCSDREMYRKNGWVACKNRAKGWGWVSGVDFCRGLQNCKEFHEVLDFQRFDALQYPLQCLCSAFAVLRKSLIFNALPTSRKCLIFNGFTHFCGAGVGC